MVGTHASAVARWRSAGNQRDTRVQGPIPGHDASLRQRGRLIQGQQDRGHVGDSPEGPLKQPGKSCSKPAKKPKRNISHLSAHTGHGPHCGGPRGPPEWPTQRPPRAGSASLEGSLLPRAGSVRDSPRGPLKQRGNPHLKPATKPKHAKPNHAGA
jgi:hypothetical protein